MSIETISDAKSELQPLRNHDGDGDAEKEVNFFSLIEKIMIFYYLNKVSSSS